MGIDMLRDAPRRQHYYFAHEYLRERAQQHPKLLIENLRKSRKRYLGFLWISRGLAMKAEEDDFIPPHGLECFPIEIGDEYYGVLVQFPTPEKMVEAYFVAIILPVGETAPASCEFYTLEFSKNDDGSGKTILGRWVNGSHFNLGTGPPPEKTAFLEAIRKLVLDR